MKNSIKLICTAAMTAGLFSCAKNETIETSVPDLTPATISVSADGMKATLNGKALTWTSGDEIAVYQYGKYNASNNRDASKNIFTFSSGCEFTGSIAGYVPTEEGGVPERYYVAYPAANCQACGIGTGKYKIDIPAEQTGLLSDFAKNATYLGSLNAAKDGEITSYDGSALTFLKGFNLYCATPVLKFNVPAALNLTKITISLKDESDAAVAASGVIQCRSDAAGNFTAITSNNTVVIYNAGNIISGDVYAVLSPTGCPAAGVFKNGAKTIIFDLENSSASAATIKLPLVGEITSGTLKNLPSLPSNIDWDLPVGPGISQIAMASNSGTAGKIIVTPEEPTSTIKYGRSLSSLAEIESIESTYSDGINSIENITSGQDAATGVVFTKLAVQTEGYSDYQASAMTWPFTKDKGFGYNASRHPLASAAEGQTISFFGLTFTCTLPGNGTYLYPYAKQVGINFMWKPSSSNPQTYPQGTLSFTAPESGNACICLDATSESNARTVTVKKGDTTLATFSTAKSSVQTEGAYKSAPFAVTAGDVITVSVNASLVMHSLTFLWESATTR